jgi:heme/copper-type cytochrome/quinol oxidase subunit 2
MAKGKNKDHVSFWFWFFALFVTALPCIGWVMIIVWAFVGENQSRKNYYRAIIAWFVIFTAIWITIMSMGLVPLMAKQIEVWMHRK